MDHYSDQDSDQDSEYSNYPAYSTQSINSKNSYGTI